MDDMSAVGESVLESYVEFDIYAEDITPSLEMFSDEEVRHFADVASLDRDLQKKERQRKQNVEDAINERIVEIELRNIDNGEKMCLTCGEKFLMLLNPRKLCDFCLLGVCGRCLTQYDEIGYICQLCTLKIIRDGKTGKWFTTLAKENKRLRRSASAVFLKSFRRLKAKFINRSVSTSRQNSDQIVDRNPAQMPNGNLSVESNYNPVYKKASPHNSQRVEIAKNTTIIEPNTSRTNLDTSVDQKDSSTHSKQTSRTNLDTSVDQKDSSTHSKQNNTSSQSNPVSRQEPSNLQSMQSMSNSMMSVYSEAEESYKHKIPISGDVLISLYYDESRSTLNVFIDQCRNIAVADRKKGRTNPYMKTYLLPDKTKMSKQKSTSKTATVNPSFKESMVYNIKKDMLDSRVLSVAVWHKTGLFSYNFFLGEVQFVLANHDFSSREPEWYPLRPRMSYPLNASGLIYKGEVTFDIQYKPSSLKNGKGAIHVTIHQAKSLQSDHKQIKAYIKGFLLPDRSSKSRKKTPVAKSSTDPMWNYLLQFDNVAFDELRDRSLELWVMNKNKLKSSDFLGGIRLNLGLGLCCSKHVTWMDAQGAEKDIWQQLLENPGECQKATINLRANLDYF